MFELVVIIIVGGSLSSTIIFNYTSKEYCERVAKEQKIELKSLEDNDLYKMKIYCGESTNRLKY